jgi:hypothetical protein
MTSSPDSTRAALLLTNRLVPLDAKPLTAREFWQLVDRVDPADLVHDDAAGIANGPASTVTKRSGCARCSTLRRHWASSRSGCRTAASR